MRILFINSVCGIRSTGRICTDLAEQFEKEGHECKIAYGRYACPEKYKRFGVRIGNKIGNYISAFLSRIFDNDGFNNYFATRKFLKWVDKFSPDWIWLHNLHDYYINVNLLFRWLKKHDRIKVSWTLHDCWAFTGHCTYFSYAQCQKWKTGCHGCPEKRAHPKSIVFDNSKLNYKRKKELFTMISNIDLITPSEWLKELVLISFLKNNPTRVVRNHIDTSIFKPTESNFRSIYHLENRFIILGVAMPWSKRKGIDDMIKLASLIDNTFALVMVGLDERLMLSLPGNIIKIKRTDSPTQLAEIYTAADVFFNPTYEDNYPTVNLEAEACGTPVITYQTGGSPETLSLDSSTVIDQGNLYKAMKYIAMLRDNHFNNK